MEFPIKYPWQQVVIEAFVEFQPGLLERKVGVAEEAVTQRLREKPIDPEEQLALENAVIALQVLMPHKEREEYSATNKKNIA